MGPKQKRKTIRWAVVVLILLILAILAAFALTKGWFLHRVPDQYPLATQVVGAVELERDGMTSPLAGDYSLRAGDQLSTGDGAYLTVRWGDSALLLDSNSQAVVTDQGGFGLELVAGQVFAMAEEDDPVTLSFDGQQFTLSAAIGDLTLGEEHQTFYLLSGSLTLDRQTYTQGQALTWTQDHISAVDYEVTVLDDFCIYAALTAWEDHTLFWSREALEQVRSDREAQRQAEMQAQQAQQEQQEAAQPQPDSDPAAASGQSSPPEAG